MTAAGPGTHAVGIDIGTTAVKAVCVGPAGAPVAERELPSVLASPSPGWAEADPSRWWSAVSTLVPALLADAGIAGRDVAAVGVSGMVPTLVAVDRAGTPLRPSIQQNDARAVAEIERMRAAVPDALARTGSAITAQSIGPKWQWLQLHEPDVCRRTDAILGSYGYVAARLTGERVAEGNWALESGLADLDRGVAARSDAWSGARQAGLRWAPDICAAAGLDPALLPPVAASRDVIGGVSPEAAAATGLRAGTPVIAGCADHVGSAYAAGLRRPGDLLVKLGGAGDVLLVAGEPVVDERLYLDLHPDGRSWLPNGCMASSGSLLRWFNATCAPGATLAELDAAAAAVPPGAGGVLALPYFLGEKTPLNDPLARGAFVGLHLGHTTAHLYRAVLEAIAFGFAHHVRVFAELGVPIGPARVTNGGSRSRLWRQVVADVLDRPLESLVVAQGSSFAAALLAGAAVGCLDEEAALVAAARPAEVIEPDPAAVAVLAPRYGRWRELELALRPISHALATSGGTG